MGSILVFKKNMAGDVFEGQSANTLTQQILDEEVCLNTDSLLEYRCSHC